MTHVLETARLTVRQMEGADAGFMLALLNDPGWIANIGDRGVRTVEGAAAYLRDRILPSYTQHGFGLYRVALKHDDLAVGMVGLVCRDGLDGPDLGFAFLEPHVGRGYGREAATATIGWAEETLGFRHLFAITAPVNPASIGLLISLGFREIGLVPIPSADDPSRLFERDAV